MAKKGKQQRSSIGKRQVERVEFDIDKSLPAKYINLFVIILAVVVFMIFLSPLFFQGKIFQSGDIIASESASSYLSKDREGFTLWNPYIFAGMPAYALSVGYTWFNLFYVGLTAVRESFTALFGNDFVRWAFYLIVMTITSFFLMKHITKNTIVSLFTAFGTSLSTGIVVFLYIGHVTKLTSLAFFPVIILILLLNQEKLKLINFFILVIAMQLIVQGFHVQIIFYILFSVGIFYLFYLIRSLVTKDNNALKNTLKSGAAFVVAALIAIAIQADNFTQIYEYTPHSTRGTTGILDKTSQNGEENKGENTDFYKYHTDWSFSPEEVMTFVVPSWYGFGNSDQNINGQNYHINTYFGQMPFVDVAMYMGVIIFFLALYAMITRWREPFVMFMTILVAISLLLSFGRNLSFLFDLFFFHFPYFDKFRVPSMILVIPQMFMPILAGLGLMSILNLRKESNRFKEKLLLYSAAFFSAVLLIALLTKESMVASVSKDFVAAKGAMYDAQQEGVSAMIGNLAGQMFATDTIINFLLLSAVFWLAWAYAKRKVSAVVLTSVVLLLSTVDLWRISSRSAEYIDPPSKNIEFAEPSYVQVIKKLQKDNDPFRIINLKRDQSKGSVQNNGNFNAYFLLEDVYGYSAIKPRAYQDFLDVVQTPANETFLNMTGTRYIVLDQPGIPFEGCSLISSNENDRTYVVRNNKALNRLFFVNRVEKKKPLEFLEMVKANKFDPADVAFIEEGNVKVDPKDSTVSLKITKYTDEIIEADVHTSGNNYLVFSTTYHKAGWHAYVDGKPTEVIKTNHDFMGIIVPKGAKKVKFEFAPQSFFIAEYLSFGLSSAVTLGLIITLLLGKFKRKEKEEVAEQQHQD